MLPESIEKTFVSIILGLGAFFHRLTGLVCSRGSRHPKLRGPVTSCRTFYFIFFYLFGHPGTQNERPALLETSRKRVMDTQSWGPIDFTIQDKNTPK